MSAYPVALEQTPLTGRRVATHVPLAPFAQRDKARVSLVRRGIPHLLEHLCVRPVLRDDLAISVAALHALQAKLALPEAIYASRVLSANLHPP